MHYTTCRPQLVWERMINDASFSVLARSAFLYVLARSAFLYVFARSVSDEAISAVGIAALRSQLLLTVMTKEGL